MSGLMEATDLLAIRWAWKRVFRSSDAFAWPFQPEFILGRTFYPTDGGHLTKVQFQAVREALKRTGETGFFLSIVESEELSFLERSWGHWTCEDASYEQYSHLHLTLENTIYSREGRWGLLISHEMHAFIAGSAAFMSALGEQYRGWSDDLRLLREAWSGNPNAGWLERAVSHVALD